MTRDYTPMQIESHRSQLGSKVKKDTVRNSKQRSNSQNCLFKMFNSLHVTHSDGVEDTRGGNKDAEVRHVFPGIQPASIYVFPEIQRGHKIRDTEQGFKLARIQKVLLKFANVALRWSLAELLFGSPRFHGFDDEAQDGLSPGVHGALALETVLLKCVFELAPVDALQESLR